ncbi:MAG: uncharacterized protein KVP18_001653 [Porospora cf. gigantea A]|uniref:uncharacterized protein n=1 Tax=Porospora cf. gigantea A TaxID=2853593 RepID=UPI0035599462|nr:MAG: hypothetical protein KVP18_001653 [Porospora cf. gigantea A]
MDRETLVRLEVCRDVMEFCDVLLKESEGIEGGSEGRAEARNTAAVQTALDELHCLTQGLQCHARLSTREWLNYTSSEDRDEALRQRRDKAAAFAIKRTRLERAAQTHEDHPYLQAVCTDERDMDSMETTITAALQSRTEATNRLKGAQETLSEQKSQFDTATKSREAMVRHSSHLRGAANTYLEHLGKL